MDRALCRAILRIAGQGSPRRPCLAPRQAVRLPYKHPATERSIKERRPPDRRGRFGNRPSLVIPLLPLAGAGFPPGIAEGAQASADDVHACAEGAQANAEDVHACADDVHACAKPSPRGVRHAKRPIYGAVSSFAVCTWERRLAGMGLWRRPWEEVHVSSASASARRCRSFDGSGFGHVIVNAPHCLCHEF